MVFLDVSHRTASQAVFYILSRLPLGQHLFGHDTGLFTYLRCLPPFTVAPAGGNLFRMADHTAGLPLFAAVA